MVKYRFTGFYPASYRPDQHEPARWIVPGEEVEWDSEPDANWERVGIEEAVPVTRQPFPSARTFPSAHEEHDEKAAE